MRLAPISLWLGAAAFAGAGTTFLVAPGLLSFVDLAPETSTARGDVRALFGGLELGVGGLLGICARRPAWHAVGLLAQGLAFGGLAIGRLVSLVFDGPPGGVTFALWLAEVLGTVLAFVAWREVRTESVAPAR